MLGKVNRSHSSKYQIHFEISSLEQNTQKKLERIVLTSDRHRSSTPAQRLAIKRADHPSSYYHSGDGSPIFPSLVSRTSASSNHLKPSSMTEKDMLWAWQEKTIVRTNCDSCSASSCGDIRLHTELLYSAEFPFTDDSLGNGKGAATHALAQMDGKRKQRTSHTASWIRS